MILLLTSLAWAEPDRVYWDHGRPGNGFLLVSLGGTGSRPEDLEAFDLQAAEMGYRVIALDYPNSVISTACRESKQPDAFDHFRAEIVQGKPESELVEVDRAHSIEGRLESVLGELSAADPSWKAFDWSKTVVVGHSQGSGHAAYLGKLHPLQAVIMLAGPQDNGAGWLRQPGQTPGVNYLSFLHRQDVFGVNLQLGTIRDLGGFEPVVTDEAVPDAHMSVIDPRFRGVWSGLLKQALITRRAAGPGWIEHLRDPDPQLGQRAFLPSQEQKTAAVVEAFGTKTPSSGSVLLHYAGAPVAADRTVPVVIVSGAKVDGTFYNGLAQNLRSQGFQVYAVTFAHNQDDNRVQAHQLANVLTRVRQLTGASQVDLVAHSKGCVVATVYAAPEFRESWMLPYAQDVRRMLLVGGPNGGIDYFHRHPFTDQGATNWPMVYRGDYDLRPEGYWPGQAQMVARWDRQYPPADGVTYYGGGSASMCPTASTRLSPPVVTSWNGS